MLGVPMLLLTFGLGTILTSLPAVAEQSIIERERQRRAADMTEARKDLERGDKAYQEGNYAEAVAAYGAARDRLTPNALTRQMWEVTNERLAQASVERARQLAKTGSREEAHQLLDIVLSPEVAPGHAGATQLKAQIDDPLRYNPAVSPQHVANVDKVRRLLYEAEGLASLGRYKEAIAVYDDVLRIDPTNTAARRGQVAVYQEIRDYSDAARDDARARMFAETAAGWEIKPNPVIDPTLTGLDGGLGGPGIGARSAEEKLRSLVVPQVALDQVTLEEAVEFLRQVSVDLDQGQLDQEQRGISFVVDLGTGESDVAKRIRSQRFDLNLRNVPIGRILKYITEATGTFVRIDEYAVVIRPAGATDNRMQTRSFRVPPDFLSRQPVGDGGAADDPFADAQPNRAVLPERLTAKAFLQKQGVSFPEGASASFQPGTSTLRVTNTQVNLDFVEQIVAAISEAEPVVVMIETRIINTQQNTLEELGFDWLTTGGRIDGGDVFLGGGTVGNGTAIRDFGGEGFNALTNGLRMGARTQANDTIDSLIETGVADGGASIDIANPRAPGIMSLVGIWDSTSVAMMMRGLNNHKAIDQVAKKSVVTRSGQKADIESVIEFIYPTEYEPPELPNSIGADFILLEPGEEPPPLSTPVTPATPTAFEMTKLGCLLEVEPLVGPNKQYVELSVKPTIRRFDGFINYGTPILGGIGAGGADIGGGILDPVATSFGRVTDNAILMPVFSVITSTSALTIADGQTVVMGGLLQDNSFKYEDKVPLLGDLPLFGRLFRSESETRNRNALVIMVTVKLLDPSGQPFRNR